MSGRAVPYFCPYCGDEDLHPHAPATPEARGGGWECRSCARVFSVTFKGLNFGDDATPQTVPVDNRPETGHDS